MVKDPDMSSIIADMIALKEAINTLTKWNILDPLHPPPPMPYLVDLMVHMDSMVPNIYTRHSRDEGDTTNIYMMV